MRMTLTIALCAILTGGCANTQSIYRSYKLNAGDSTSVLIDAKQRAILAHKFKTLDEAGNEVTTHAVCAEPSPDVAVAMSGAFAAAAKGGDIEGSVAAQFGEAVAKLSKRNATVQLLRDIYYRNCEMYMNNALDFDEYTYMMKDLNEIMLVLLAVEQVTSPGAGDAPVIIQPPGGSVKTNVANRPQTDKKADSDNKEKNASQEKTTSNNGEAGAGAQTSESGTREASAATEAGAVTVNFTAPGAVDAELAKTVYDMLELIVGRRAEQECLRYMISMSKEKADEQKANFKIASQVLLKNPKASLAPLKALTEDKTAFAVIFDYCRSLLPESDRNEVPRLTQ